MFWQDMREEQFPVALTDFSGLCVVPLSAMDKKGQYLPVGADGMIVDSIVQEAAKLEDAVIFPTGSLLGELPAPCGGNRKGAIQLSMDLRLTLLNDLCDEIGRNGFRKILIVYKEPMDSMFMGLFMRYMGYQKKPYATLTVSAVNQEISKPENILKAVTERAEEFPMITEEDRKTLAKWAKTGYGVKGKTVYQSFDKDVTFCDTALVVAQNEELVAQDRYEAENYESAHAADALTDALVTCANMENMNYPNGCCGFAPHGCTKSIGEAVLKLNAEFMAGVFKLVKEDERCVVSDARYV